MLEKCYSSNDWNKRTLGLKPVLNIYKFVIDVKQEKTNWLSFKVNITRKFGNNSGSFVLKN